MSKIYYVSDYHFFHELALKRSRSDCFNSIEEMNEEIIKRHNEKVDEDDDIYILGDIIVSIEKVREQAEEYGHSFERELAYLVTHGMLHLLGYDHMIEEEKAVMRKREEEILETLNITR